MYLNQNITASVQMFIENTTTVLLACNGVSEFLSPSLQPGRKDVQLMMLNTQSDSFSVMIMPNIIVIDAELKESECIPGTSFLIHGRNFIENEYECFVLGKAFATRFLSSKSLECSISMAISGLVGIDLQVHLGINSLHAGSLNCSVRSNVLSIH
jgi:hypothetical protein